MMVMNNKQQPALDYLLGKVFILNVFYTDAYVRDYQVMAAIITVTAQLLISKSKV